jgi:drug/metabolite transporter (DMT)-like permease
MQGLVFNYITAASLYYFTAHVEGIQLLQFAKSLFPAYVFGGLLFISIFYLTALSTQKNGVAVATIASKMSVVIPVFMAVVFYNESINGYKLSGLVLALGAVYLSASNTKSLMQKKHMYLPVLLFLGAGFVDTFIKYWQASLSSIAENSMFFCLLFFIAGLIGLIVLIPSLVKGTSHISKKNIAAGILLGTCNFSSLYFLIAALRQFELNSGKVFIVANCGVVLCTVIFAVLLFHQQPTRKVFLSVLLALTSIFLLCL